MKIEQVGVETRDYLEKLGYPRGDYSSMQPSTKSFEAGGQYGVEIASAQTAATIKMILKCVNNYSSFRPNRLTETRGIFRLSDMEIKEMVNICLNEELGLVLSVGPRAFYDTSASARSEQGARISYRLRGMDNVVRAIEDVKRAVSLGVRGILVYDEGLLSILNQMKLDRQLPPDLFLKVSVHTGHGNPLSLKLLESIGANSVNTVGDLDVSMISTLRQTIDIPIDIHTDTPKSSGGFIRTYEVPDLIVYGSPIFLKCGAVTSPHHAHLPSEEDVQNRVSQAYCVYETMERYLPEARAISPTDICVPIPQRG